MYIPLKNAQKQPLSPVTAIILGVVFLAVTSFFFYMLFMAFKSVEIWKISKHNAGLVLRKDNPDQFWSVVTVDSIAALLFATASVMWFVLAFRKDTAKDA